jgi:hypothetical protein
VHRFRRSLRTALVASAGVATALGIAGLTQSASGQGGTSTSTTSTTKTSTTSTSTTNTTTTPTPKPKPKAVKRTISCKAKLYATRPPVSTALEFATLSCGSPLGKGVQHNSATVSADAERTAGTFNGSVRIFFNEGALRGTYRTKFTVANATVTYDGTIKVSSGTGDFAGVKGTGTITGSSTDGLTSSLREKLTLTFPPAAS